MSFLINSFLGGASFGTPDVLGAISASTSMTLPAHVAGDILVMFAYRDGNNNTPALPAGWTALTAQGLVGANTNTGLLAYKVAASSSETSGTWTNATGLACQRIRGPGAIAIGGNSAMTYGSSTSIPAPAIPAMTDSSGHSVVLAFAGQRNTTPDMTIPPPGMTNSAGGLASACVVGCNYTTTGVTGWAGANASVGGVASGYATATVEITGAV